MGRGAGIKPALPGYEPDRIHFTLALFPFPTCQPAGAEYPFQSMSRTFSTLK
jgi:hypothetical protein